MLPCYDRIRTLIDPAGFGLTRGRGEVDTSPHPHPLSLCPSPPCNTMQGVMHQWAKIIEFSVYVATPPPNPCNYDKGTCLPICAATTCECLVSRVSESGVVVVIVVIAPFPPLHTHTPPSPIRNLPPLGYCSLCVVLCSLLFGLCSLMFDVWCLLFVVCSLLCALLLFVR